VARRSIESRKRQYGLAVDMINVPEAFALGTTFDDFAVGPELDHTLVITHSSVKYAGVNELFDRFGFHGCRCLVLPKVATPFAGQIADQLEAEFFVGQRVHKAVASESPFVLASMLEYDLTSEVKLNDRVDIPTRAGAGHRVIGAESSPTQVETLFVSINMLEREVRMLGVEPDCEPEPLEPDGFDPEEPEELLDPLEPLVPLEPEDPLCPDHPHPMHDFGIELSRPILTDRRVTQSKQIDIGTVVSDVTDFPTCQDRK
jgi:hypothetical protein